MMKVYHQSVMNQYWKVCYETLLTNYKHTKKNIFVLSVIYPVLLSFSLAIEFMANNAPYW